MNRGSSTAVAVVDRLTPRLVWQLKAARPAKVIVLEAPDTRSRFAGWCLKKAGLGVEYPDFFMGDLRGKTGESAYLIARDNSYHAAIEVVGDIIRRSKALTDLEGIGRPGTLSLWLTKNLLMAIFGVALRLEAARMLAGPDRFVVWLNIPPELPLDAAGRVARDMTVVPRREWLQWGWLKLARTLGGEFLRAARSRLERPTTENFRAEPTILTVREEDLVEDPSFRGQLHWLNASSGIPPFRTILMPRRGVAYRCTASAEALARSRVVLLSDGDVTRCLARAKNKIQRSLTDHERSCLLRTVTAKSSEDRLAAANAWTLVRTARRVSAVIEATGARAWVGCEAWFSHSDAVNLVADAHAVRTLGFQYGSIRKWSPQMISTFDVMATLGTAYSPLYRSMAVGPGAIVPIGYPYSYAAPLVAERARATRADLTATGATFVICYFDESVQHSRWGFISRAHHLGELTALARAVVEDPTLAVLIKTKYAWNDPVRLYPDDPLIRAAGATGRFKTIAEGLHRNAIFPAEAALAADIAIGHAFGATAALEAALAGTRAVLIRRYGERTLIDDLLAQLDVVFPSIESALVAIGSHRKGAVQHSPLGVWSAILPELDAYRDGAAAHRLRAMLEDWVVQPAVAGDAEGRENHNE